MQTSINELEVIVDESNAQISSLREQLSGAQEQLAEAAAASTALQGTEADLKQQLQDLQVRLVPYMISSDRPSDCTNPSQLIWSAPSVSIVCDHMKQYAVDLRNAFASFPPCLSWLRPDSLLCVFCRAC